MPMHWSPGTTKAGRVEAIVGGPWMQPLQRFAPPTRTTQTIHGMACRCLRHAGGVWALAAPRDAAREPGSRGLYHQARVGTNLRLTSVT